jgi:hypothetical protein
MVGMKESTCELIAMLRFIASCAHSTEERAVYADSMRFQKRCFGSLGYRDYIRLNVPDAMAEAKKSQD